MKESNHTSLESIAEILMGQSPEGITCNEDNIGTPLLNGPTEFGDKYPAAIQYTTDPKRLSQRGDILFCVRGSTTGRMNYANKEYAIGRGLAAIRHKAGLEYQPYLRGIIDFNLPQLLAAATGSTFPNVSRDQLNSLVIPAFTLSEQRKIAAVLGMLDDKIELLRAQNRTLEGMAQALFKQWFVKFDFPNAQGQPYQSSGGKMAESDLGEIPEGWRITALDKVIKVINGYSYKGNELIDGGKDALVTLKSFDRNGGFQTRGFKPFRGNPKPEQEAFIGSLIVAHTDLTQDAEVLGNPAIVFHNPGFKRMYITMDLVKVQSKVKEVNESFLYFLMKTDNFKQHCVGYSNGTTVLHLSKKALPEYLLALPDDLGLCDVFSTLALNIISKVIRNRSSIQALEDLRNDLLPEFMQGRIRINHENIKNNS